MTTTKILSYEWKNMIRGKWLPAYGLLFMLLTDLLIRFGGSNAKALLSLTNVVLLFIPLAGLVYGVLYLYQSKEFVELLLAQPIARSSLFWGLYSGLAGPMTLAYIIGTGLPLTWHSIWRLEAAGSATLILVLGSALTLLFVGIGFLIGLQFYEDRIKGLGLSLILWLLLAVLYDGLIMSVIYRFSDYPLQKPILGLIMLNPIDLARIVVLLDFDISALMGYTGAVFKRFFAGQLGMIIAIGCMALWWIVPLWLGRKLFARKDF